MDTRARVIIACDLRERSVAVVETGLFLAEELGLPAALVHVLPPGSLHGAEERARRAERELRELLGARRVAEVPVEVLVREGAVARELLSGASPKSMIVLGAPHRRAAEEHHRLDRAALEVIRTAPCAVLTISSRAERASVSRILYAVDLDGPHEAADDVVMKLVDVFDAKLVVVHVTHVGAESGHAEPLPPREERRYHAPLLAALEEQRVGLDQRRKERGSATSSVQARFVVAPDLVGAILETAKSEQCDLIVLGTHGRKGMGRLVLGSTAEGVLRRTDLNVLTMRRGDR